MTETRSTVVDLLRDIMQVDRFEDDTDVLENGMLDSFGILQLITALEERFAIRFDDSDLSSQNFRSVVRIDDLVRAKLDAG